VTARAVERGGEGAAFAEAVALRERALEVEAAATAERVWALLEERIERASLGGPAALRGPEAAVYLAIGETLLASLVKQGAIRPSRLGAAVVYPVSELDRALREAAVEPASRRVGRGRAS